MCLLYYNKNLLLIEIKIDSEYYSLQSYLKSITRTIKLLLFIVTIIIQLKNFYSIIKQCFHSLDKYLFDKNSGKNEMIN